MQLTERFTGKSGALLVVDVQEKLVPRIVDRDLMLANAVRLVRAAKHLGLPVWATEQYPEGLGPTVPALAELIPHRPSKTVFHCCAVPQLLEQLYGRQIRHLTLAGIEAHVCVSQTALELLRLGFGVQVPADAVGSRSRMDWEFALRRMERAGAVISTTEAVLFEWTERLRPPRVQGDQRLGQDVQAPRPEGRLSRPAPDRTPIARPPVIIIGERAGAVLSKWEERRRVPSTSLSPPGSEALGAPPASAGSRPP